MQVDDLSDGAKVVRSMKKRLDRIQPHTTGDALHRGSGLYSVQLGEGGSAAGESAVSVGTSTDASGISSVSIGDGADASDTSAIAIGTSTRAAGESATSVGPFSSADAERSGAFGWNAWGRHFASYAIGDDAETTASNQIVLGRADDTVVVPGTFSNPSARRLKENITPAPALSRILPELVEYEYIDGDGTRKLGVIADELIGTDYERFVTLDDDGEPLGVDYLGLMVAVVLPLAGRVAALESRQGICPDCVSRDDTVPLA